MLAGKTKYKIDYYNFVKNRNIAIDMIMATTQ